MEKGGDEAGVLELVRRGCVEEVRLLLEANRKLTEHEFGPGTLLHLACRKRSVEMVRLLISYGADVNRRQESSGSLPLTCAIDFDNPEIARLLLQHNADIEQDRPLIGAVVGDQKHSLEMVKLLESFGADIHRLYPYAGRSSPINAISMASAYGKRDVVEYLRSRGARMPEEYSPNEIATYRNSKNFGSL